MSRIYHYLFVMQYWHYCALCVTSRVGRVNLVSHLATLGITKVNPVALGSRDGHYGDHKISFHHKSLCQGSMSSG